MIESFMIGFLFFLLGSIATSCFVKMIYMIKIHSEVRRIRNCMVVFDTITGRRGS